MTANNENSLIPVSEVIDNTPIVYQHSPYRNLTQEEIDLIIILLHEHKGVLDSLIKDPRSPVRGNGTIHYYKRKYNLLAKLGEYRKELVDQYKKDSLSILGNAKVRAIQRAMELLEDREMDVMDKSGRMITLTVKPGHKEVKCAWEIIKTEMGEVTKITKEDITSNGENINQIKVLFKDYSNGDSTEQNIQTTIS